MSCAFFFFVIFTTFLRLNINSACARKIIEFFFIAVLFNQCDFDFLQSKGSNASIDQGIDCRSSLLIRFDPLLGRPVPRTPDKQPPPHRLSVTKEEDSDSLTTRAEKTIGGGFGGSGSAEVPYHGGNATMSAGLINDLIPENEVKPFDSINNK